MRPLDFPLLADENIHSGVVAFLLEQGCDILSIATQERYGLPDIKILRMAQESKRVVLTHDSDFGGLAVLNAQPYTGIIYLRPGMFFDRRLTPRSDAERWKAGLIIRRSTKVTTQSIVTRICGYISA
ncbi:MAG: hypothetical protein FJZ96_01970, partial [Chloroflexi bacterium]|nr:hypothetical protein [Chloroflexota bacterium]